MRRNDLQTAAFLRAIIVEDLEEDALLIRRELERSGYAVVHERVQEATALRAALATGDWDIILSDYSLPGFGAPAALAILQNSGQDIPFVVVSGVVGEEVAVDLMRSGAGDYVMKNSLHRLGPVVRRELTEAKGRHEHALADAALQDSERRRQLAIESARMGTWELDLTRNPVLELSTVGKALYGRSAHADFRWRDFVKSVHSDDFPRVLAAIETALKTGRNAGVDYQVCWPDGSTHWLNSYGCRISDSADGPVRLSGVTQDVTERKEQEAEREARLAEAQDRADRDPLTGLWNHTAFHRRLASEAEQAWRADGTIAVVLLDLDNFKFFNDAYGYSVGNMVLLRVAQRLRQISQPYDTIARFGGDEFALLLPSVGQTTAAELETCLRTGMSELLFHPEGQEATIPITLAVGASVFSPSGAGTEAHYDEGLRQAEERLRRVKRGMDADSETDQLRLAVRGAVEGFSMLDALVTAVDNKDRYTRRHSEDVLTYSLVIARALEMDEGEQHIIAVASLLHDVGKIGVPDAILRKPSRLTDEEFDAIRLHPTMGAAIVATVPGLEAMMDAVRHHHERWDGQGYPSRLRGEETPLIARLMAVADSFSAMTTDRPYRTGMTHRTALALLAAGAGTQWDPRCVEALLRQLEYEGLNGEEAASAN